jgi:hypothetical protein
VLAFFWLTGCALWGKNGPPPWVNGTSPVHPAEQFLTGVGRADNRPSAEERAYGAVARIFKAEVTAQSHDWESFLVLEQRSGAQTERRLTLDQLTRVSSDKVLENVRILDNWHDPSANLHYALAGMNRAQAAAAMTVRISELDGAIDTELREAKQSSDRLAQLRNFRRALKDLVLREAYNADLRIIQPDGRGLPPTHQVAALTSDLERFMTEHIIVGVEVSGEQAEPVRRAVMEGLLREKLPVTMKRSDEPPAVPDAGTDRPLELLAKGTVQVWPTPVPDPQFKYARWCSDFVLVETGTQRVVGAVSRSGREGHITQHEATAKAIRVMQQELTAELSRSLAGYVFGEVEPPAALPPAACPRREGG